MTIEIMEIVVPQVGEAVAEVILVQWFKQEGDRVRKGEPLFEVDTDKVLVEVEAFADGVLEKILVPAESPVLPQQVVGALATSREKGEAEILPVSTGSAIAQGTSAANDKISPVARRVANELGVNLGEVTGSGPGGQVTAEDVRRAAAPPPARSRVLASPKARRLAQELGVDLAGLAGAGVDGLITADDVQAAASTRPTMAAPAHPLVRPFSKLRRAIAASTQASKQTVPHFYLMADVDMTLVQQLRSYCQEGLGWEKAPTYTDILVRACGLVLAVMPEINVVYTEGGLLQRPTVDIGVAVHVEGGLVAPALRQVEQLSLQETSRQLRALVERSRAGRLREADLGQKSMVVSNLGMYGVDAFIAIVDMPDPMILAVGRVGDRVTPVNGQPSVRPVCTLTLSADHRVLDGAPAAQFLTRVKEALENPFALLG